MRSMRRGIVLAAVAALAWPPFPAAASDVGVAYRPAQPATRVSSASPAFYDFRFRGGFTPGEDNDAVIHAYRDTIWTFDAAGVTAGTGCEQLTATLAKCRAPLGLALYTEIHGDSGNDELQLDGTFDRPLAGRGTSVDGGPGDDVVIGASNASSPARLGGGGGRDTIRGGPSSENIEIFGGGDVVDAGPGIDAIVDNPPPGAASSANRNVLDGGEGVDYLIYANRREEVAVDLAAGTGGDRGEDELRHIESVSASSSDRADLRGDEARNQLAAGGGEDVLLGRGGTDYLSGGPRRDFYDGGDGDDVINDLGRDDGDEVACGEGNDLVAGDDLVFPPDPPTRIGFDCESLAREVSLTAEQRPTSVAIVGIRLARQPVAFSGETAIFELPCRQRRRDQRTCWITAALGGRPDEPGARAVSRKVSVGQTARLTIPLTDEERFALERGELLKRVRVMSRYPWPHGWLPDYEFSYILRQAAASRG